MRCILRFFGPSRDVAGEDERAVQLPDGLTLTQLRERLAQDGLLPARCRLAVNRRYEPDDYVLRDDDEVAVIPPVSGG